MPPGRPGKFWISDFRRGVAGGLIEGGCPRWFGSAACAAETAALQGSGRLCSAAVPAAGVFRDGVSEPGTAELQLGIRPCHLVCFMNS